MSKLIFLNERALFTTIGLLVISFGGYSVYSLFLSELSTAPPKEFMIVLENETLRAKLQPQVEKLLKSEQKKRANRQQFDRKLFQLLKKYPAIDRAVAQYRISGSVVIQISTHEPGFSVHDSRKKGYIFNKKAQFIGIEPVPGVGKAPYALKLEGRKLRLKKDQKRTLKAVPPLNIRHVLGTTTNIVQAAKAQGLHLTGGVTLNKQNHYSVCIERPSVNASNEEAPDPPHSETNCLKVELGKDPRRRAFIDLKGFIASATLGNEATSIDLSTPNKAIVNERSSAQSKTKVKD